jgi:hypothetical protein
METHPFPETLHSSGYQMMDKAQKLSNLKVQMCLHNFSSSAAPSVWSIKKKPAWL